MSKKEQKTKLTNQIVENIIDLAHADAAAALSVCFGSIEWIASEIGPKGRETIAFTIEKLLEKVKEEDLKA